VVRLWGYVPGALALALVPAFLLALERGLVPERRSAGRSARWYVGWASAAALLAAWLHPWQGELMLGLVAALVVWRRDVRDLPRLALPVLATLSPLVYYYVLSKVDADWATARMDNAATSRPILAVLAALAPLLVVAARAVRRPRGDVQEFLLLAWPCLGLALFLTSATVPFHALEGMTLPLAVLAVRAVRGMRLEARALVAVTAAVAAVTLAGVVALSVDLVRAMNATRAPVYLSHDESAALGELARSPRPGGVFARLRLGAAIPAMTGRQTWVGQRSWTPHSHVRARRARALLDGRMATPKARGILMRSGARFLLLDCRAHPQAGLLDGLVEQVRRFGCVRLYLLR
jgi:hypothetical protein